MKYGMLEALLYMCRLMGVAPFTSLSTLQVSRAYAVYGKVLAVVLYITCIAMTIMEIYLMLMNHIPLSTTKIIRYINISVVASIVMIGIVKGPKRITRMGEVLRMLDQINQNLGLKIEDNNKNKLRNKLSFILTVVYVLGLFLIRVVDNAIELNQYLNKDLTRQYLVTETVLHNMFGVIQYKISHLLMLQIALLAWRVHLTFQAINIRLGEYVTGLRCTCMFAFKRGYPKLAWESKQPLNNFIVTNRKFDPAILYQQSSRKDIIIKSIRQLNNYLLDLCDIVRDTCEEDGVLMALVVAFFFTHLEINLFAIIFWSLDPINSGHETSYVAYSFIWYTLHGLSFIIFAECCHRTAAEVENISVLLNTLRARVSCDKKASREIELLQNRLSSSKKSPLYSPLGLCTVNRLLIFKVFGCTATSFLILLSHGPDSDVVHN